MKTITQLEADVRAEIALDPRIPVPDEVAISSDDGAIVLRGTVGSFRQRRAAISDAREIEGVYDVYDELEVRLLDDSRRDDAEIRGIALQFLMWDAELPSETLDVHVTDGWVTLKGDVMFQFQSDLAFEDVAGLIGVVGITNEIRVTTP
ncbi:MAG: OsmY protein [Conexibacter sp.]|jgi:osmotically-inducible protein OsmY|nr:OsmY protein [Conexibacter sp.]